MAQPLNNSIPIVNPDGTPTQYFIKLLQENGVQVDDIVGTSIIAGTGLSGGGLLNADVTLALANIGGVAGSYTNANITVDGQGRITLAANGSGGSGAAAPAIRSSNLVKYASAASFSHPLPTGAANGDFVVVFHSGGFGDASISSPAQSLWDTFRKGASNWGGTLFCRQITADDVSAGSVTVTPTGTFDAVIGAVCFTGNAALRYPFLEQSAQAIITQSPGAGATSSTQKTPYASADDCILCFFSNRDSSTNTTTFGTQLQTTTNANGSGALYANESPSAGGQTAALTYGTAGSGRHEILLVVRGPY